MKLVLGTRGSALALAQVELVCAALRRVDSSVAIEVKRITTSGDRSQDKAWQESGAGLKGMFTKEIEDALLAHEIDIAVHSCKDLPGRLANGCEVAAVLERAPTDDVLLLKSELSFHALKSGAHIATSSVRRQRQLQFLRPDLIVQGMRGNVPTRLGKLQNSDCLDAIVLARAGLERLGYTIRNGSLEFEGMKFGAEILPTLPAIGQGAIALEIRAGDSDAASILRKINHFPTFQCIRAERELLRLLDGDCGLPVGAKTELIGAMMSLRAIVFGEENQPPRTGEAQRSADEPEALARDVFAQLNFSK